MPYMVMLRFDGDPEDLLARKQEFLDPVTARVGPTRGGLVHLTATTPEGLLVINVLADQGEGQDPGMSPEVIQALRESGLPQPRTERYELARLVVTESAAAAALG